MTPLTSNLIAAGNHVAADSRIAYKVSKEFRENHSGYVRGLCERGTHLATKEELDKEQHDIQQLVLNSRKQKRERAQSVPPRPARKLHAMAAAFEQEQPK